MPRLEASSPATSTIIPQRAPPTKDLWRLDPHISLPDDKRSPIAISASQTYRRLALIRSITQTHLSIWPISELRQEAQSNLIAYQPVCSNVQILRAYLHLWAHPDCSCGSLQEWGPGSEIVRRRRDLRYCVCGQIL